MKSVSKIITLLGILLSCVTLAVGLPAVVKEVRG
jgi:hypothetical protein